MLAAKLLAIVALVALTLNAGLQVDVGALQAIFRKPGLLARLVAANLIAVPLLGLAFARWFQLSPEIAAGVLLMAIAPGVPGVLIKIEKKGGSLDLGVALAVVLPVLAVLTIPITADLVLPPNIIGSLPLLPFVSKLVLFQLVPLFAGVLLAGRLGERAAGLHRILEVIFAVSLMLFLILLMPRILEAVSSIYGERGALASSCIVLASFVVGFLFGGSERDRRRVFGLGTMLRNVGLASTIATTSFQGDIVTASVLTYFLVQTIASVAISLYFMRTAA